MGEIPHLKKIRAKWLVGFAVLAIVALSIVVWHLQSSPNQPTSQPQQGETNVNMSRAVIIDGIGLTRPNHEFIQGVKEVLSRAGLSVDVYQGEQVTMDLLNNVGGYGLIILRLHSAVDRDYGFLYLFSTESYSSTKYLLEQSQGAFKEAHTFDESEGPYFALRADLFGREDGLKGSTIILMGCNGTNSEHAINKLLAKGVKAIIAWDGYVDLEYTDNVTLSLLKTVYEEGVEFQEAVEKIMTELGSDPLWKSKLEYLAKTSAPTAGATTAKAVLVKMHP